MKLERSISVLDKVGRSETTTAVDGFQSELSASGWIQIFPSLKRSSDLFLNQHLPPSCSQSTARELGEPATTLLIQSDKKTWSDWTEYRPSS